MPINTLMSIQNAQNKFNKVININNYLSTVISTSSYIQSTSSFVVPSNFTIECWVKITTLNTGYCLLISHYFWTLYLANGKVSFTSSSPYIDITGGPSLNDGLWHHIACSIQSYVTNGTIIYIDGVAVLYGTCSVISGINYFKINNSANFFTGNLAEIRYWSIARTADNIYQCRYLRFSSIQDKLIHYWYNKSPTNNYMTDLISGGLNLIPSSGNITWSSDYPTIIGDYFVVNSGNGNVTSQSVSYNGIKYVAFYVTGDTTIYIGSTTTPSVSKTIRVLAVGGGGGGGGGGGSANQGGGGGGGGVVDSSCILNTLNGNNANIVVTIGTGGSYGNIGAIGNSSTVSFDDGFIGHSNNDLIAGGGGGGGNIENGGSYGSVDGGSGGGCGSFYDYDSFGFGGGIASNANNNMANNGGSYMGGGNYVLAGGGGGGGAGTIGGNSNIYLGGNGGNGYLFIDGKYYGGGGGGYPSGNTATTGGFGGGGKGNSDFFHYTSSVVNATANTGGGGGGGVSTNTNNGGAGGSGVVVILFPV